MQRRRTTSTVAVAIYFPIFGPQTRFLALCSPSTAFSSRSAMHSQWGFHSAIASAEPLFDLSDDDNDDGKDPEAAAPIPVMPPPRPANGNKMLVQKYEAPFSCDAIFSSPYNTVLPSLSQPASKPTSKQNVDENPSIADAEASVDSFEVGTPDVVVPVSSPLMKRSVRSVS